MPQVPETPVVGDVGDLRRRSLSVELLSDAVEAGGLKVLLGRDADELAKGVVESPAADGPIWSAKPPLR